MESNTWELAESKSHQKLLHNKHYLTNSTYGYIKWTKYIKEHNIKIETKKLFSK